MLHDALTTTGPQAAIVLDLWRYTLVLTTIVYVALMAALWIALKRAPKAREDTPPQRPADGRSARAVAAAVALSIVGLMSLIVASIGTDRALARLPLEGALHIELTGHQWWWEARYDADRPDRMFTTANELHLPVGRPVILTLKSADVIHAVWLPNVVGKKDLIPGRTATLQLRIDREGTYLGPCTEFCGLQHARMALTVVAEPQARYDAWAERQRASATPPADGEARRGHDVFMAATCAMCHTVSGTDAQGRTGPDLTHVGSRQRLAAGVLPNTPDALAKWIANPSGFKPGVNMPAHALAHDDLRALAAYLGGLK